MRSLSAAVNVRRRGRSTSSGDAAGGAETSVGLRPSSFSAPPAAKGSLAVVRGMTISMFHLTPSRVNFRGVDVSSSLTQRGRCRIPTDDGATGGSEITYRPPRGLFSRHHHAGYGHGQRSSIIGCRGLLLRRPRWEPYALIAHVRFCAGPPGNRRPLYAIATHLP